MKKRITTIFLSIFFVLCCLFGCTKKKTDEELVRERIDTFVTVYNDGDFEGVLECFDAKTRNTLEAAFNVMGGLVGGLTGFSFDLGDLFTLGVAMMGGEVLAIEVDKVEINGANAVATAKMGYADIGASSVETVYIVLVKENGDWYIVDMQDDMPSVMPDTGDEETGDEETGDTETKSGYPITSYGAFVDGRAWVEYKKSGEYYWGFIDMAGNAVYSEKSNGQEFINIGKGSGIVQTEEDLKLIDKNGEVRLTLEGETEIKYGGGYVLVYQDQSTITSLAHMYGQFDHNGTWLMPMENLEEAGLLDKYTYVGEGMIGEASRRDTTDYTITGAETQDIAITIENTWVNWDIEFENGMAYVQDKLRGGNNYIAVTTDDESGQSSTVRQEIDGNFILYTDGRAVQIDTPTWYTDGKTITEKGGYYEITDYTLQTPKTATLTKYPVSMVEKITFLGDYGLLELCGVDKKHYFTLIDTNGNELFEPIYREGYSYYSKYMALYPDGNVIWWHEGEESSYYERVDKEGKVLVLGTSGALVGGDGWIMPSDTSQEYLLKANSDLHYSYYSFDKKLLFLGVKEK